MVFSLRSQGGQRWESALNGDCFYVFLLFGLSKASWVFGKFTCKGTKFIYMFSASASMVLYWSFYSCKRRTSFFNNTKHLIDIKLKNSFSAADVLILVLTVVVPANMKIQLSITTKKYLKCKTKFPLKLWLSLIVPYSWALVCKFILMLSVKLICITQV